MNKFKRVTTSVIIDAVFFTLLLFVLNSDTPHWAIVILFGTYGIVQYMLGACVAIKIMEKK